MMIPNSTLSLQFLSLNCPTQGHGLLLCLYIEPLPAPLLYLYSKPFIFHQNRSDSSCCLSDRAGCWLQRPGLCHLCCEVRDNICMCMWKPPNKKVWGHFVYLYFLVVFYASVTALAMVRRHYVFLMSSALPVACRSVDCLSCCGLQDRS